MCHASSQVPRAHHNTYQPLQGKVEEDLKANHQQGPEATRPNHTAVGAEGIPVEVDKMDEGDTKEEHKEAQEATEKKEEEENREEALQRFQQETDKELQAGNLQPSAAANQAAFKQNNQKDKQKHGRIK